MFKKVSLELGGKNPNIIFADAEMDKAIKTTVNSSFMNQGEICLCGSRVFVERSAYESVKSALVAEVLAEAADSEAAHQVAAEAAALVALAAEALAEAAQAVVGNKNLNE